jgi:hypothetical protein
MGSTLGLLLFAIIVIALGVSVYRVGNSVNRSEVSKRNERSSWFPWFGLNDGGSDGSAHSGHHHTTHHGDTGHAGGDHGGGGHGGDLGGGGHGGDFGGGGHH